MTILARRGNPDHAGQPNPSGHERVIAMRANKYVAVRVDAEHNAEEWWDEVRAQFPGFARALERNGAAVILAPLWGCLAAIPGFADGPEYASTALIDCGGEGEQWADVVANPHQVFDVLE